MRAPFFSAFHTLTVDDAGRGAGFARGFLAALEVERMMDAIQRAVPVPQAEVIMHGASGRQILGQRAPLAAGAQNVHHAVDHLADSDAPFAAAGLARRDQRLDMRPFRIGQVARITQFVAVVARAVVGSPHGAPQEQIHHPIHPTHKVPGRTLRRLRITADSALQEGPPDNRFIRLIKSPDGHSGVLEAISKVFRLGPICE